MTVIFSEEVVAGATGLSVIGPDGKRVDEGNCVLDLNDMARQTVTIGLQPDLGPGAYSVSWHSTSVEDGDTDQGTFMFNVGSASPGAIPAASPPIARS